MSTDFYLPQTQESVVAQRQLIIESFTWNTPTESVGKKLENLSEHLISPWCNSTWKRIFDLICVIPALILISPLLALLAIAVRCTSKGPIIFRQQRVGQHRRLFVIYKFRTMVENSHATGPGLTATGDPRITSVGHFLRRFKLDELPQLFNVLLGDMSLVGPRPKLPELESTTMPCRPGVTGAATLMFRKEQHLLRAMPTEKIGEFYAQYIAPTKVRMDAQYMASANFRSDFGILWSTLIGRSQHITLKHLMMQNSGQLHTMFSFEKS